MLGVPTLEIGDPVPLLIEMKTHDSAFQACILRADTLCCKVL